MPVESPPAPAPATAPSPSPAPAPAAPSPAPAPTPSPAANNGIKPPGGFEAYDRIAKLAGGDEPTPAHQTGDRLTPDPDEKPPVQPDQGRARGPDGKFIPTPEEKRLADEKAKAQQQPPTDQPPQKAGELRKLYDQFKAENAKLKAENEELKKPKTPTEDPEKRTLKESLSAREKRLAELEEKLKFTDYSQSTEYKEEYEKPFVDAYMRAQAQVTKFKTREVKDPETGEITSAARQLSPQDFDALVRMPVEEAIDKMDSMFSPTASATIMGLIQKVHDLNGKREEALVKFRKMGTEMQQKQTVAQQEQEQARLEHFEGAKKWGREKFSAWFTPDADDPKGKEVLDQAEHWVTRAFSDGTPIRDGDQPLSPPQLNELAAAVFNQAVAHPLLLRKFNRLTAAHAELQKKIAGLGTSTPGAGDANGNPPPPEDPTDKMAAFNKRFRR